MQKKIGISHRVEIVGGYAEQRDCLDQRWSVLAERLGFLLIPVPNYITDHHVYFEAMDFYGFILSGGNDPAVLPAAINPSPERDLTENKIMHHADKNKLPLLGVCRGLQMINLYCGGTLSKISGHVAVRHQVTMRQGNGFTHIDKIEVNSYHSFGLKQEELGNNLLITGIAEDNSIESVSHTELPWKGIMWHPEREKEYTTFDITLIQKLFHLT